MKRKNAVVGREELRLIDGYWRAADYLSAGQIYLDENPHAGNPRLEVEGGEGLGSGRGDASSLRV